MARLDIERQERLEPTRMDYAKRAITGLGYTIIFECGTRIEFNFKGESVTLYPYSGWHTGKSIQDGRGIRKLLNQIT